MTARRRGRIYALLRLLAAPLLAWRYRYRGEPIPETEGPVFVLCNHNTDLDPVFLGLSSPRQLDFVAAENVARAGLAGRLLMRIFDPILVHKGVRGVGAARSILKRLRAGRSVALFPEGNRSFNGQTCPITPAAAKLAKASGATLVTYRITGGYFTSPRWGAGLRRGRMRGHVAGVYPPALLGEMTREALTAAVERDLWTDACAEQASSPLRFRGRRRAEYLESVLFLCPSCGGTGTLRSRKNRLSCSCGYGMTFTEYGLLRGDGGEERTIPDLDRAQRDRLAELAEAAGEDCLFSDELCLRELDSGGAPLGEAQVRFSGFRDRFRLGERDLPMDAVDGISIHRRNLLLLHLPERDEYLELSGPPRFNALKYLYLYRLRHPSANGVL